MVTNKTVELSRKRRAAIMDLLVFRADKGLPMPSNAELCAAAGIVTKHPCAAALGRNLQVLEEIGLIKIERANATYERRVMIVATEKWTGWQLPQRRPGSQDRRAPKRPDKGNDRPRPLAIKTPSPFAAGISDAVIYGHLADHVRECRRRGDVVYRNPRRPLEILINGRPGDPKARAAWHASKSQIRGMNTQVIHSNP